jgi:4-carboxymuconolactone decarboxylase
VHRLRDIAVEILTLGLLIATFSVIQAADPQIRSLVHLAKISASGASGQLDKAEQLFRQGKEGGLSEVQMYEAVLNLVPYVGYPRTLNTMGRFQKVYPNYVKDRSGGKELQPTEPWPQYAVGPWVERSDNVRHQLGVGGPGAEELVNQLTSLSPELAEWARYDAFGRIFGRPGLSLLEREAVVMGAHVAQGVPQFIVHYKALLRVGGTDALVDEIFKEISDIVDAKALTTSRQYLAEARRK